MENLVGYAKADLMVPLLAEGQGTLSVAEADAAARAWCEQVNTVVHSEIVVVSAERLGRERELLAGLPLRAAEVAR